MRFPRARLVWTLFVAVSLAVPGLLIVSCNAGGGGSGGGGATNNPPVITSTRISPSTVPPGGYFTLEVTASDADGDALSYSWRQTSGPSAAIGSPRARVTSAAAPPAQQTQTLEFEVDVSDGLNAAVRASLTLIVQPLTFTNSRTFSYDAAGRITEIRYPSGRRETHTYDLAGNLVRREVQ